MALNEVFADWLYTNLDDQRNVSKEEVRSTKPNSEAREVKLVRHCFFLEREIRRHQTSEASESIEQGHSGYGALNAPIVKLVEDAIS